DGFVLVSIAGLVLLEVVPGAFSAGGITSALFVLIGLLGPTLVEHLMTRARREAHIAALVLAITGLVLHSIADGAALAPAGKDLPRSVCSSACWTCRSSRRRRCCSPT